MRAARLKQPPGTAQGLGVQLERVKTGAEDHDNDRGGQANKRCIWTKYAFAGNESVPILIG